MNTIIEKLIADKLYSTFDGELKVKVYNEDYKIIELTLIDRELTIFGNKKESLILIQSNGFKTFKSESPEHNKLYKEAKELFDLIGDLL